MLMAAVNFINTHLRVRSVSPSARHPASIWNMISRTFAYLTQAFIVFGFVGLVTRQINVKFEREHFIFTLAAVAFLIALLVVPD